MCYKILQIFYESHITNRCGVCAGALLDARIARFEKEITPATKYRQRLIQDDLHAWQAAGCMKPPRAAATRHERAGPLAAWAVAACAFLHIAARRMQSSYAKKGY